MQSQVTANIRREALFTDEMQNFPHLSTLIDQATAEQVSQLANGHHEVGLALFNSKQTGWYGFWVNMFGSGQQGEDAAKRYVDNVRALSGEVWYRCELILDQLDKATEATESYDPEVVSYMREIAPHAGLASFNAIIPDKANRFDFQPIFFTSREFSDTNFRKTKTATLLRDMLICVENPRDLDIESILRAIRNSEIPCTVVMGPNGIYLAYSTETFANTPHQYTITPTSNKALERIFGIREAGHFESKLGGYDPDAQIQVFRGEGSQAHYLIKLYQGGSAQTVFEKDLLNLQLAKNRDSVIDGLSKGEIKRIRPVKTKVW